MEQYVQCNFYLRLSHYTFDERIFIFCQNQISARGMREAMLNVLFHLLSQQQTRISCDRYMIVVKETEMKCNIRCPK